MMTLEEAEQRILELEKQVQELKRFNRNNGPTGVNKIHSDAKKSMEELNKVRRGE